MDLGEFEVSLGYRSSSRTGSKATQRNSVSKKTNKQIKSLYGYDRDLLRENKSLKDICENTNRQWKEMDKTTQGLKSGNPNCGKPGNEKFRNSNRNHRGKPYQ